jgi:hypothetical protein
MSIQQLIELRTARNVFQIMSEVMPTKLHVQLYKGYLEWGWLDNETITWTHSSDEFGTPYMGSNYVCTALCGVGGLRIGLEGYEITLDDRGLCLKKHEGPLPWWIIPTVDGSIPYRVLVTLWKMRQIQYRLTGTKAIDVPEEVTAFFARKRQMARASHKLSRTWDPTSLGYTWREANLHCRIMR